MKDSELLNIVLQKYYEHRRQGPKAFSEEDFPNLGIQYVDIPYACQKLSELGFLSGSGVIRTDGFCTLWIGQITAQGVERIEGTTMNPLTGNPVINIHGSQHNLQIGNHNTFQVTHTANEQILLKIIHEIDKTDAPVQEKEVVKNRLKDFLRHPMANTAFNQILSNIHKIDLNSISDIIKGFS